MFGLDVDTLRGIRGAIEAVPSIEKVLIYGSRAKGNYEVGSDIDISLMGRGLELRNSIYPLRHKLEELLLPYMFDISILKQIDDLNVVEHILRVGQVFYDRSISSAPAVGGSVADANSNTGSIRSRAKKNDVKGDNITLSKSLPSGWRMVQLGDVCEVVAGQSPKGSFYNTEKVGTPFFQGKKEFGKLYLQNPTKWTTSVTKIAKKNDVLMSVRAPVGPVNLASSQICIGRGLAAIRSSKKIDHMFLFHQLFSMQDKIEGSGGAVFSSISKMQIEQILVPLPPLEVQNKIVEYLDRVLGDIDKLTEKTRQNLKNCDELFKSYLQQKLQSTKSTPTPTTANHPATTASSGSGSGSGTGTGSDGGGAGIGTGSIVAEDDVDAKSNHDNDAGTSTHLNRSMKKNKTSLYKKGEVKKQTSPSNRLTDTTNVSSAGNKTVNGTASASPIAGVGSGSGADAGAGANAGTSSKSLPPGWRMVKLGDVCDVIGGGTPSTSKSSYWNGNVSWITPKDLSKHKNPYISGGQKTLTQEGLRRSSAKLLPKNTVVVSTRAPIGYVAITSAPLATNQGFRSLVLNKKMIPEYAYHFLKSNTKLLNDLGSGTTFKELSGSKLKTIVIPLPPLEVQKQIVKDVEAMQQQVDELRQMYTEKLQDLSDLKKIALNRALTGKTIN